ncbi:MAG: GNAT family N-acetyltransferase [Phycisphaerales bacterium]|nr:GNAT family N-acetyltransferase [Planctomycetota bacterium]
MLIRPAAAPDVPQVLPLVRAICDLHAANDPERFRVLPDVIDRYAAWLPERAADPRSIFLVAEHDNAIVGYVVCTIEPEIPIFWIPECGWIHDIYVRPDARHKGAARELLRETIRRFRDLGVKQLRLHTGTFNESARAFFAKEGFRPSVVEMLRPMP